MRQVTIDEERFVQLLKTEEAHFDLIKSIDESAEHSTVYGEDGNIVAKDSTYKISNETLEAHVNKAYNIWGGF